MCKSISISSLTQRRGLVPNCGVSTKEHESIILQQALVAWIGTISVLNTVDIIYRPNKISIGLLIGNAIIR